MKTQTESLWETLKTVNDWIKVSDSKSLAIIGFQGVFLSFILSKAVDPGFTEANDRLQLAILLMSLVLSGISVSYAFICVNPRLRLIGGVSPIYFGTISEKFKNSSEYQMFFEEKFKGEDDIKHELAGQVYVNSKIAWRKFRLVALSIRWLVVSLGSWSLYLVSVLLK